ncbi:hypothetical protein [Photobacterium leiognathi]|uniref:hypothetical protein n=1 Tax=Photobacterium leiognathi TaxID=553611 RepID=UPI002981F319|nr:hypothetical protein [Photobacterium leiognathi]
MFHGSASKLPIGITLFERSSGCENALEQFVESYRASNLISRLECAYCCDSIDDIDACGGDLDFVYLVESVHAERSDQAWLTECQIELENGNTEQAAIAAKAYWQGLPFTNADHSVIEVRTKETTILKLIE